MPKTKDKHVYDIRVQSAEHSRLVAVSADATLLDLHLALLGAFNWKGDYGNEERGAYRLTIGKQTYSEGRGSRMLVRRVLGVGDRFTSAAWDPELVLNGTIEREYEVASRRHYPRVFDTGEGENDAKVATWRARSAARRELRAQPLDHRSQYFKHGLLCAVASGPMLRPSLWLSELLPLDSAPNSAIAEMQRKVSEAMQLHNDIASRYQTSPEEFGDGLSQLLRTGGDGALIDWNRGYVYGMALAGDEWQAALDDPDLRSFFEPIGALMTMTRSVERRAWLQDVEFRDNLARAQGVAAFAMAQWWRRRLLGAVATVRRTAPKVSANAPCPCGSGKKYKRCCSPVRVADG